MAQSEPDPPFWKENWPWIVVPALVVIALALWFALSDSGGGDFQYGDF